MKHQEETATPERSDKGDPDRKGAETGKRPKKPEPPPRDTHEWPSENPPVGEGPVKRDKSAGRD